MRVGLYIQICYPNRNLENIRHTAQVMLLPYKGLWRLDGGWDKLFGMAVSVNPGHRVSCIEEEKRSS